MLTESEIKKIEERTSLRGRDVPSLLATVKEQRELLRKCAGRILHEPAENCIPLGVCCCDKFQIEKQIEQALK